MKKITLTILAVFLLALNACSTVNGTDPASVPQNGDSVGQLPMSTQLILGTLKLDETENAVTADQAAKLLPLWQTLQVLADSDTAAQQETEALIAQIQETMTAEQRQVITEMELSREDMMSVMQEQGLAMGAGPVANPNNSTQNGNSSGNGGGNFGPGAGMPPPDERGLPGGGPGFGGEQGQNLSSDQIATAQAARQAGGGDMVPVPLINAVIKYLEEKADA